MAPPQPKAAAKPAAAPAGGVAKPKKVGKPRNYDLGNGVVRFSKSRMYHKKVSSSAVLLWNQQGHESSGNSKS